MGINIEQECDLEELQILSYSDYLNAVKEEPSDRTERVIEAATFSVATANEAQLISTGPEAFEKLESLIKEAGRSIHLNVYSWAGDSTGMRGARLLAEAKKRSPHLDIQVHIDKLGCLFIGCMEEVKSYVTSIFRMPGLLFQLSQYSHLQMDKLKRLQDNPTEICYFSPEALDQLNEFIHNTLPEEVLLELNPALKLLKESGIRLIVESNHMTRMDHSKVMIFDGDTTLAGGMNIGDEYSGGYEAGKGWTGKVKKDYWKDYMIYSKGPASAIHRHNSFGVDDVTTCDKPEHDSSHSRLRVLHNRGGEVQPEHPLFARNKQITFALTHLLDTAEKEIVIEHAYLMD